jgi:superfamily II DNA/RNA helicase
VFFTAFRETAARIHRGMTAMGSFMLTGETPQEERTQGVALFQAGKFRSFVTTFGAGGVGITLTKAQTVILVDRPWTPGDTTQAEDRIHRIGQRSAVLAIWVQWDETDQAVDAILDDKHERIELVMSGRKVVLTREMTEHQLKLALAGER